MICLFDSNAETLIRKKDYELIQLTELETRLIQKESEILLNTDFKELGLTNEKMRQAYVNQETIELKEQIKEHKNRITIIDDLIKLRLQEVKTE